MKSHSLPMTGDPIRGLTEHGRQGKRQCAQGTLWHPRKESGRQRMTALNDLSTVTVVLVATTSSHFLWTPGLFIGPCPGWWRSRWTSLTKRSALAIKKRWERLRKCVAYVPFTLPFSHRPLQMLPSYL